MIGPGSLVIVHLVNPTEKFWGVLQELGVAGVMLRGINVSSFDDWMAQAMRPGEQSLGLSTMFVPLFRVSASSSTRRWARWRATASASRAGWVWRSNAIWNWKAWGARSRGKCLPEDGPLPPLRCPPFEPAPHFSS